MRFDMKALMKYAIVKYSESPSLLFSPITKNDTLLQVHRHIFYRYKNMILARGLQTTSFYKIQCAQLQGIWVAFFGGSGWLALGWFRFVSFRFFWFGVICFDLAWLQFVLFGLLLFRVVCSGLD